MSIPNYLKKYWLILLLILGSITIIMILNKVFIKDLDGSMGEETDPEVTSEKLNDKLAKLNKQIKLLQDENKLLNEQNQELSSKLDHINSSQTNLNDELCKIQEQKIDLEQNYRSQLLDLNKKNQDLETENNKLNNLLGSLNQQIKNYKNNSYNIFQAGKLEVELANLNQLLSEKYDYIAAKKNDSLVLKQKCENSHKNYKFCQDYRDSIENIVLLEQQIDDLKEEREELKERLKIYLSVNK